jgi:ubiquinone/menaquinone biosynthesis C-methylase UbiE
VPRKGQGLRLLDIACGQGFFLEAVEQSGTELELRGIDFSPVVLDLAQEGSKNEIAALLGLSLPYGDEFFDYVSTSQVWNILMLGKRRFGSSIEF